MQTIELGLLLLVTFLPLHVVLVKQMGLLPGAWKELLMAIILFLCLSRGISQKNVSLVKAKTNFPILLFILYCCLLLLKNMREFGANIMGLRNLLEYSILYFLIINIVKRKKAIKKYVFFLLCAGGLIALVNSVIYLSGPGRIDLILHKPYHSSTKFLAYGFLGANNYPVYLDALICVAFGLFLFTRSKRIKWLLFITIFILVISSLLTYSRGGILALILSMVFYGARYNKKSLIVLILLCLAGVFFMPSTIRERFVTSESYKEAITSRTNIWAKDSLLVLNNLFFGIGLGRVGTAGGEKALYPHNYYLYLLLQTGIFGLAIYLWIFAVFFKTSLRLANQYDERYFKGLLVGISMYYIMFAVSSFIMASGEAFLSAYLFWFLGRKVLGAL